MHFLQILYFTAEMEKVHAMESVAVLVKYLDASIAFTIFLLPPSTKFGQGYIFTGICDPVHRGGSALVHAGILPPPSKETPPCAVHAGRYSQQAGGMHPTGMQFLFCVALCCFSNPKTQSLLDSHQHFIK